MALKTSVEPDIVPGPITASTTGTTTVLGFDPVDTAKDKWFSTSKPRSDVFGGCEVIPYLRSDFLFPDIVAAMRTVSSSDHFILIAGWNLSDAKGHGGLAEGLQLDPGDPTSTIKAIFEAADKAGAVIRALLFKHDTFSNARDNSDSVTFINGLAHGLAILDDHVVLGLDTVRALPLTGALSGHYIGAHHQKIIIVNGTEGLIAFQGGYDLDADRIAGFGGHGLHDVHTRIRGTAAKVLADAFVERWNDHPLVSTSQRLASIGFPSPHADNKFVQVAHTFPNPTVHPLNGGGTNSFAPSGETTVKQMLLNAIAQARKFIYVEDQYLFDMDISAALKAALPNLEKLIILIVASDFITGETLQPFARRKKFIDNLPATYTVKPGTGGAAPTPAVATFTGKVSVCQLKSPRYVHSKTWIFDDRFAIIGSANVNRRGMTHDSEQTCGIFDVNAKKRWFFAHELRMNLWAKHLGKSPIDYQDPVASSVHWFAPIGDVEPYNPNGGPDADPKGLAKAAAAGVSIPGLIAGMITEDAVWDSVVDPDGT